MKSILTNSAVLFFISILFFSCVQEEVMNEEENLVERENLNYSLQEESSIYQRTGNDTDDGTYDDDDDDVPVNELHILYSKNTNITQAREFLDTIQVNFGTLWGPLFNIVDAIPFCQNSPVVHSLNYTRFGYEEYHSFIENRVLLYNYSTYTKNNRLYTILYFRGVGDGCPTDSELGGVKPPGGLGPH